MPINPNPQGKGLVPVLQSLGQDRPSRPLPPKHIEQVEMELFTSLFVLQGKMRFHPVVGRSYWLYQYGEHEYRLLMVAPEEWQQSFCSGRYIGECVLQDDRTWTLELAETIQKDAVFMRRLENQRRDFQSRLQKAERLEDVLPVYEEDLGFHARILAFTLGRSLAISMDMAGIKSLTYAQARGLLEHEA